jgi:hypothetical protein
MMPNFASWLVSAPLPAIGSSIFAITMAAAAGGYLLRCVGADRLGGRGRIEQSTPLEDVLLSAKLGLLALLLGFTYSLAINRFEIRRELVLQEANAVGTAYLRAQLLDEPHRSRISKLLGEYSANRIRLAQAGATPDMLARNDKLITQLWAAEAAAFDSVKALPFSVTSVEAMNNVIDFDSARKAARYARIPEEAFVLLILYMALTAGTMGYSLSGARARSAATMLLALFTLALLLVIDVDRPTADGIRESQRPMELTQAAMAAYPPGTFDRYRGP